MSSVYEPPSFDAPIDLDLSRNEGRPTISEIDLDTKEIAAATSRYPRTESLREAVAHRHGLPHGRVMITAGGDDALFRCFLANAGSPIVATTPSFEMIRRYADQVASPLIEVPWWGEDFPVDDFLDSVDENVRMAIVVSPNNPTGNVIAAADLRKLAGAFPLVVLDGAYTEFADDDPTDEALSLDNVVVIRTLSKAYGLAGLRVGYLLGPEHLVTRLTGFGSPYSVSSLSAALAKRVLTEEADHAGRFVEEIKAERSSLIALLGELGCSPLPSQANFVLATAVDPAWLVEAAASLGIGLRRWGESPELARAVRVGLPGDSMGHARLEMALRTIFTPEALIFDMDGVLADVRDSYRAAIVETARSFDVVVTGADISAAKARGEASDDWELTRGLCAAAGVDVGFDDVRDRFESIYQGDPTTPGLKENEKLMVERERLERLSVRMPLGIVTARPRKDAEEFLDRFGVAGYFAALIAREDAPSKPDPAPVRLALERLDVSRAWMLGDTVDDLRAARGAGVLPIGVVVAGDDPSALVGAARVLRSANEIEEVLDGATS